MTLANLALREASSMAKCLFSKAILKEPKPEKFTAPYMKTFDGKTDLVDFLHLFSQVMILEMSNENLLCKVFPQVLSGTTTTWFNQL